MGPGGSPLATHWDLDPGVTFLNHGSFGACPRVLLAHQAELRRRLESQPVRFMMQELPDELDLARVELAEHLGCSSEDLVFVANATTGVNAVVHSFPLGPGDEILTTDHDYNACRNALKVAAERVGATVRVAHVPFPLASVQVAIDAVLNSVTERTRLVLLDHLSSPTAVIFPVERLVPLLESRGIAVVVDGAHVPGQLDLDLGALRPSFYTGNLHKWMCAPKGCAFLYAREDRRDSLRPTTVSHGENYRREGRSHFHDRFDWCGTVDPTAFLCAGESIRWCDGLVAGGLPALRERNHRLAVEARELLGRALKVEPPCAESLLGSMAALPLGGTDTWVRGRDPLKLALWERFRIEVPVMFWNQRRWLRISAQAYNAIGQYEYLAQALRELGAHKS